MSGFITFGTIIISLLIGYFQGVKTKRKKINNENKQLKKENAELKHQIKRMRSIRYDYQLKTGAYKKKDRDEFKQDIILTINLDSRTREEYLNLLAIIIETLLCDYNSLFDLEVLQKKLQEIEDSTEIIEFDLGNSHRIVDVWGIRESLEHLFNNVININEYQITFNDVYLVLEDILNENQDEYSTLKKMRRAFARDV